MAALGCSGTLWGVSLDRGAPPGWRCCRRWGLRAPAGAPQCQDMGGSSGDQSGYGADRSGNGRDTGEGTGSVWGSISLRATAHKAYYGDLEEKHQFKPTFHHPRLQDMVPRFSHTVSWCHSCSATAQCGHCARDWGTRVELTWTWCRCQSLEQCLWHWTLGERLGDRGKIPSKSFKS